MNLKKLKNPSLTNLNGIFLTCFNFTNNSPLIIIYANLYNFFRQKIVNTLSIALFAKFIVDEIISFEIYTNILLNVANYTHEYAIPSIDYIPYV